MDSDLFKKNYLKYFILKKHINGIVGTVIQLMFKKRISILFAFKTEIN